jgi:hypothetical protein
MCPAVSINHRVHYEECLGLDNLFVFVKLHEPAVVVLVGCPIFLLPKSDLDLFDHTSDLIVISTAACSPPAITLVTVVSQRPGFSAPFKMAMVPPKKSFLPLYTPPMGVVP